MATVLLIIGSIIVFILFPFAVIFGYLGLCCFGFVGAVFGVITGFLLQISVTD